MSLRAKIFSPFTKSSKLTSKLPAKSKPAKITANEFERYLINCGARADRAARYAHGLVASFVANDIVTPLRIAHAVSQLMHESARLRYVSEIWGPTPAQRRYQNHPYLGNTRSGDGSRYRGRGLIQLTGRANYTRFKMWLYSIGIRADVVANPLLVAGPTLAPMVFGWFWNHEKHLNAEADRGDHYEQIVRITRRINGGTNGLADRRRLFMVAMREVRQLSAYRGDQTAIL